MHDYSRKQEVSPGKACLKSGTVVPLCRLSTGIDFDFFPADRFFLATKVGWARFNRLRIQRSRSTIGSINPVGKEKDNGITIAEVGVVSATKE